jgi:predicted phage terminase large subunit-like protein
VEDKGSGISLIQQLRAKNIAVVGIKAADDKRTRLYTCTPMFEAGSVLFLKGAPWLDALLSELLAFPNSRHDDQVDSISQALTWIRERRARLQNETPMFVCQVKLDEWDYPY